MRFFEGMSYTDIVFAPFNLSSRLVIPTYHRPYAHLSVLMTNGSEFSHTLGHKRPFNSDRERQHPGTPNEQNDTGGVTKPVASRNGLFEQYEQCEARDPVKVHHAAEK